MNKFSIDLQHIQISVLVGYMLDQPWHDQCKILPAYVPPFAKDGHKPEVQVHFNFEDHKVGLRYSNGPKQGFFWDSHGDNLQSIELAIIALSQAPVPRRACVTFKIPSGKKESTNA